MKIVVAGTGYVGLVTGVCLSEVGHSVTCTDIDATKIQLLNNGVSPIYEPGLNDMINKNLKKGSLLFTTNMEMAYSEADIIFIAVGTPENLDGSANLTYIYKVAKTIAKSVTKHTIIVMKSTVPVGTNEEVLRMINEHLEKDVQIDIVSNPEFLREGTAIFDTFNGDRIVIGSSNDQASKMVGALYEPFNIPIVYTDLRSSEMIKYAANAFLATKISFINEISNICEKLGANIEDVANGIGYDKRIGKQYLKAGIGYGGSCFPKDTKALVQIAGNVEHQFELLESVIKVNNNQQQLLLKKLKRILPSLDGKRIAILGLSFKPNTDDIREAASIFIINDLLKQHAEIIAYDPIASTNVMEIFKDRIMYGDTVIEAITNADCVLIVTDWKEILNIPFSTYVKHMKTPIIIDGRNCYSTIDAKKYPVTYLSVGREEIHSHMLNLR